jgi:hypothetical protein
LIAGEIALTLVLVVGAGLLVNRLYGIYMPYAQAVDNNRKIPAVMNLLARTRAHKQAVVEIRRVAIESMGFSQLRCNRAPAGCDRNLRFDFVFGLATRL